MPRPIVVARPPPSLPPRALPASPLSVAVPAPTAPVAQIAPIAPIAPIAAATASAPADKLAQLQAWVAQQQRLYRVAAPLLLNNTELCTHFARRIIGFTAKNQYSYSSEYVEFARNGLGLDERLRIGNVLPGSGAEAAGLERGDILLSTGDRQLPKGADAERAAASMLADAVEGSSTLELTVLRDSERISTTVRLTPACAVVIDLGNSPLINSYADGRRVMVTRGMLDFVQSDDELAYVLAREIATNIVSTAPRSDVAALIDRLHTLGVQPGGPADDIAPPPFNVATDLAADRMALYLLARAHYRLAGVHDFWQQLATIDPADMRTSHAAMHAPIAERLGAIAGELPVVRMKEKTGRPLTP